MNDKTSFLLENDKIDVEKIMNEIYKSVETRYDEKKINDINKIMLETNVNLVNVSYRFKELYKNIEFNNSNWLTFMDVDIENQKFVRKYVKKVIRKSVRWIFKDSLERQNNFNGSIVRSLNEVSNLLAEQLEITNELKKRIVEFEMNNKVEK